MFTNRLYEYKKNKNKAKSKNHKETAAGKSTWQTFEAGCQAFIDELAQEYVSVGFTASPTIANVQGAPGKYLVCQAIMCGQKLT